MKKILLFAGVMVISCFGLYLTILDTDNRPNIATNSDIATKEPNNKIASIIEHKDKETLKKLELTHPVSDIEDAETTEIQITKSFLRMHEMGKYFNHEKLRRDEMAKLLEDPAILEMSQQVLTNQVKSDMFGENQALARVYAIKLLVEEARRGNLDPLLSTTSELANKLDDVIKGENKIEKRRDLDLEELLRESVKKLGVANLADNPGIIYDQLGYQKNFSGKIISLYDDALFFPLKDLYGREKASKIVAQIIDSGV